MAEINVNLTVKQCDLIALALDILGNTRGIGTEDRAILDELYTRFDALSESKPSLQKTKGIHLVYDRDSNVRPLFPK